MMEQHRRFTIVMTTDGLIEKAYPLIDADIGCEVDYEPLEQRAWLTSFKEKFFTIRIAALACVFLLALLPVYMVTNSNETFAYVDIDINPSMELEIDNDLEVTAIIPFNEDAELLLNQIGEIEGKNIEDAIEIIINTSEEKGLINAAKNVLIGVHYLNDEEKDPIIKTIEEHFDTQPTDWEVVTVVIPEDVRVKAKENQQSMNKALANSVTDQSSNRVKTTITEEDKEVLQSFFNKSKADVEITNDNSSKVMEPNTVTDKNNDNRNTFNDERHPRELKGKNGDAHSDKNGNSHHNGKIKEHDKDRKNDTFKNKNDRNKDKSEYRKNHSGDKSKHKDEHKYKQDKKEKWDKKDRKGKEDKKQKNNNGRGHDNKRNNGDGNEKNKNNDFSIYK